MYRQLSSSTHESCAKLGFVGALEHAGQSILTGPHYDGHLPSGWLQQNWQRDLQEFRQDWHDLVMDNFHDAQGIHLQHDFQTLLDGAASMYLVCVARVLEPLNLTFLASLISSFSS